MSEVRENKSAELHELIGRRWSPRAFDASRPVERDKLISLLEAARWSLSCFNDQPWRFVVGDRYADEKAWQQVFGSLTEKNRLWAGNAPLLIVATAASEFRHNGKSNRWAEYDTGAAAISICLQAGALGLSAHQMGGFDSEAIRKAVGIPDGFTPMAVIAVGYHGSPDDLAGDFRSMETGARKRLPLPENFYAGRWGEGV